MRRIMENYFIISGLAHGKAFCNRKIEKDKLKYNIETNTASLIISPRRYGKTSLVKQVLNELKLPYAHIDLYKALNEQDIVEYILSGIGSLLGKIEPIPEKLAAVTKNFFSNFEIAFAAHDYGIRIKWGLKKTKTAAQVLLEAFERLDHYAAEKKCKAVIYLDEFQSVYQVMRNNHSIEAAIREAAQKSQNINYIFSGSTRHIIDGMFNDKTRPFYRLCDTLYLKRIESKHYKTYINHAAKLKWDCELEDAVIERILTLTENYPYYVNKLCHLLWSSSTPPTLECVDQAWRDYAYESKMSIDKQIDELSLNQKRVMIKLCQSPTIEPYSSSNAEAWGMNSASIYQAINTLVEKDHLYQRDDGTYALLDPLVKMVLDNF